MGMGLRQATQTLLARWDHGHPEPCPHYGDGFGSTDPNLGGTRWVYGSSRAHPQCGDMFGSMDPNRTQTPLIYAGRFPINLNITYSGQLNS